MLTVVATVASILLQPKNQTERRRPPSLGDFTFPTATENRVVPIVYGSVRLSAPNVTWYGALFVEKLKKKIKTGLFSSTRITVGFRYNFKMDMALCMGPIDELTRIIVNEVTVLGPGARGSRAWDPAAPEVQTIPITEFVNAPSGIEISHLTVFGGREDDGGPGGMSGDVFVYGGLADQGVSSTIVGALSSSGSPAANQLVSAYRNVAHVVWGGRGYHGNRTQIDPWEFDVKRFPTMIGATDLSLDNPRSDRIGANANDANPIICLYELLTDPVLGRGIPTSLIDEASFLAAARTCRDEDNGWSFTWDDARAYSDIVEEIMRQVDGVLYQTGDGVFKVVLVRATYPTDKTDTGFLALPLFDEDNIEEFNAFDRGSWDRTSNDVQINFADRTRGFVETSAIAQDVGNEQLQSQRVAFGQNYPGVKEPTLASFIAGRDLRQVAFPFATMDFTTNRSAHVLRPGDVFRLSWALYGVANLPCRVVEVEQGTLEDETLLVRAVEDTFGLGIAGFSPPPASGFVMPGILPLAATIQTALDSPYFFAGFDSEIVDPERRRIITAAVRPNGVTTDYEIYVNANGTQEVFGVSDGMTPSGRLDDALPLRTGASDRIPSLVVNEGTDLDTLTDVAAASAILNAGENIAMIGGPFSGGNTAHEFVGYESVTVTSSGVVTLHNVHRALGDTVLQDWPSGTRVWFLSAGAGATDEILTELGTLAVFLRTLSAAGDTIPLGSANLTVPSTVPDWTTGNSFPRAQRPYPMGNVAIRSVSGAFPRTILPASLTIAGGPYVLEWSQRNRLRPGLRDFFDPTHDDEGEAASQLVNIDIRDQDGGIVLTEEQDSESTVSSEWTIPAGTTELDVQMHVELPTGDNTSEVSLQRLEFSVDVT